MSIIGKIHQRYVFRRRVHVLTEHLAPLFPNNASVLDVGCGDGSIGSHIKEKRPDIRIEGIDVLVREKAIIPVTAFDGTLIPFGNDSFDVVIFVDVLHHTDNPTVLLREAKRVARQSVILKDHTRDGALAVHTLRFMDWIGNAHHGVALPYNYWSEAQWRAAFTSLNLEIRTWSRNLELYPWPGSLLFDRSLHFIADLAS